jgi:ribosome biogenesis GTPase
MLESLQRGQIVRSQSGFYTVNLREVQVTCQLRGRLKKGPRLGDLLAVGDWVQVWVLPDGQGVIEAVEPRRRMLVRLAPTPRGEYQQIILANPDQVTLVFACANPAPRLGMLDRFLVIAEKQSLPAFIVANKVDLVGMERAQEIFAPYPALGYPVIYTSTKARQGLDELSERLRGKLTAFVGPSGAGKSSLLNVLQPGLGLRVREVSRATSKGRHTTVVREMFPLLEGGYIADTPGLKALAIWDVDAHELDGYFPELRELVAECQFSDCTHQHEPGCAVQVALEQGEIARSRYESYLRMRSGEEE